MVKNSHFDLEDGEADPFASDDDESEHKMDVLEEDDEDDDMDEEDLDDELNLPNELNQNLDLDEKLKLLRFKKNHSEMEWEQEIDSRMQVLNKKIDLQRLKRMQGLDTSKSDATPANKKATAKKPTRAKTKSQVESESDNDREIKAAAKAAARAQLEESDEEGEQSKPAPSQRKIDDFDESDDLFDSEEEKRISEIHKSTPSKPEDNGNEEEEDESEDEYFRATPTNKRKPPRAKPKRSKRRKYDSDSEDEESEEDEDADFDVRDGDTNINDIKERYKTRIPGLQEKRDRQGSSKKAAFESLKDLERHWKEAEAKDLPPEDNDFDPADLTDYIKITLRRDQLVGLLNEPFFENYVKGCFVRYSLGAIESFPVYRMCEILSVAFDGRPYKVPAPNGNGQIETKLRLTLSTGGSVKEKIKIDRVSNHTIQQNELDFHLQGLASKKQLPLTKRKVKELRFAQKQYRNHVYSHDDIKKMVMGKVGLNKVLSTEYTNAMNTLIQKRQEAIQNHDDDALRAIQKTISALETENERQKQVFEKAFKKQIETNKKMRENNTKRDLLASMQKRKEDREAQEKGVVPNSVADPFIRRETRPTNLWVSKLKKDDSAPDPKVPTPRPAPATKADAQQVNYEFVIPEEPNMDEIRQRVIGYLGFDVMAAAMITPKERYLQSLHLPATQEEREALRGGNMTLAEYLSATMETTA